MQNYSRATTEIMMGPCCRETVTRSNDIECNRLASNTACKVIEADVTTVANA